MKQKSRSIFLPITAASFVLFFIFLPAIISTEVGKNGSLALINRFSPGKVKIKDLSLSWLGSQKIEGLHYDDTKKGIELRCQEISLATSLLKMLFFTKDLNSVMIIKPEFIVTADYITPSFIEKAPKAASFMPEIGSIESIHKGFHGFKGRLTLKQGSLEVKIPSQEELIFSPIEVDLNVEDKVSAILVQIDTLLGDTKGYLRITGSLNQELTLQAASANFPLKGADQIVGLLYPKYKDVLVDMIGPTLDMDCSITSLGKLFATNLNLQSQNVKTSLQASSKEDTADLISPAFLDVRLTPEGNKKASSLFPDFPLVATISPLTLHFIIDTLHFPMQEEGVDLGKVAFSTSFSSDSYPMTSKIQAALKGKISSLQLQEKVNLEVNIEVQAKKALSQIDLVATLLTPLSEKPSIKATLTTQKVPTSLIDSFFSFTPSLFIGSWIQGTCLVEGSFDVANLSLQLVSPLFSLADTSLEWKDKELTLLKPVIFAYQITPSVVDLLAGKDAILLKESATATMEISKASLAKDVFLEVTLSLPNLFFDRLFTLQNYTLPSLTISTKIDTFADIHLEARNSLFRLDSDLSLEGQKLILTSPLKIEYTLLKQDFFLEKIPFSLLEEAKVTLTCNPTTISLEGDLKKAKIQSHLESTSLHLQNKQKGKELTLQNISSDINFSGLKEVLDFSFSLDVASSSLKNSLKGSLSLQKILTEKAFSFLTMDLTINNLSLAVLEDFYPLPLDLTPLIGDTISSSLHLEKIPALQSLSIQAETPTLKAKGTIAMQEDMLFFPKNSGPFTIEYTLTPEGYKALTHKSPFALSENALFTTSITDLSLPYLKNTKLPDLANTRIKAVALNEKATFRREGSKESMVLSGAKISLQKEASQKELTLIVDTKAKTSSLPEGALHLNVVLSKFLSQEGAFSLADLQIGIQAKATQFPSTALDIACALKKEPFTLFLGPSFEATLDVSLQNAAGPIAFNLQSSKAHLDFGGVMESGSLKLAKDLKADVLLTAELGKFLLSQLNASSVQSLFSPTPLTVTISSQGFSFPLNSMDLSKIQIPSMRMDFGKLYCKNKGAMVSFLRQLKSKEPEGKEIQIWIAPMDLHVKQGVVDVERTEILLDKAYDVALWGEVNLPNNSVNMIFGLTAQALKEAFGIQELPDNYVLKIPITGTLQDIKIKSGTATSKITALLLWQSKALSDAIGPFGGLLKKVIPPPGGDGKAPPAKTPYPWQADSKRR